MCCWSNGRVREKNVVTSSLTNLDTVDHLFSGVETERHGKQFVLYDLDSDIPSVFTASSQFILFPSFLPFQIFLDMGTLKNADVRKKWENSTFASTSDFRLLYFYFHFRVREVVTNEWNPPPFVHLFHPPTKKPSWSWGANEPLLYLSGFSKLGGGWKIVRTLTNNAGIMYTFSGQGKGSPLKNEWKEKWNFLHNRIIRLNQRIWQMIPDEEDIQQRVCQSYCAWKWWRRRRKRKLHICIDFSFFLPSFHFPPPGKIEWIVNT